MNEHRDHSTEISRYEFSGIEERHGTVPKWLAAVCAVLLVWMVFYLIIYWTDRG